MKLQSLMRRLTAATLLPFLMGLPLPSMAAMPTPQQALNDALKNEMTRHAGRMVTTARIDVTQRSFKVGVPTTSGHVAMRLEARALPTPTDVKPTLANSQGEGRFVIESADMSGIPDSEVPLKLDGPVSMQWKLSGGMFYIRLETLPQSLIDLAKKESDMNLGELVGRWVKIDLGDTGMREITSDDDADDLIKTLSRGDAAREARIKLFFARTPFFLVSRVEKRMKNAAGDDVWRMRIRLNPAIVNFFYREALRELPPSGTARTEMLREINKSFATIRLQLSRTSMAVNINVTKKQLERFEIGGTYPETVKDCKYNYTLRRSVCTNVGTRTIKVAIGVSMSPDAGGPVEIPTQTITMEEAQNLVMPPPSEPMPIGDITLDSETTLVAPGATVPAFDAATDHVLGPQEARVSVITYSDFQCPYCARIVPELKALLGTYPIDVKLVYRHFPLSSIHPEAQKAAEASECAAKLGGNGSFWQMHDKLFDNQAILGRDAYVSFARQLDLNEANFISCLDSGEMALRVKRDGDMAATLGLQGTPTTFFNGTKVEGAVPFSVLQQEAMDAGARQ